MRLSIPWNRPYDMLAVLTFTYIRDIEISTQLNSIELKLKKNMCCFRDFNVMRKILLIRFIYLKHWKLKLSVGSS